MNKHSFLYSIFVVVIIPAIYFTLLPKSAVIEETEPTQQVSETSTNEACFVKVQMDTEVVSMELDTYVASVLAGEMPADFELEALKAQSVAVRTYTLRKRNADKHIDADVCVDPTCCQAFRELESMEDASRVIQAVASTSGQVLTYDGKLIDATYFSCSGGRTEDAAAVWGADVPYLQSKDSPGEENATHYVDTVQLTVQELRNQLNLPVCESISIGDISYTEGGGIATIEICGRKLKGTEVRTALSLRSTALQMRIIGDSVIITTKGNGHRVGLSQYGAEAMAVSGKTYDQILEYYYSGTKLEKWSVAQIQGVFDKAGIL